MNRISFRHPLQYAHSSDSTVDKVLKLNIGLWFAVSGRVLLVVFVKTYTINAFIQTFL